MMGQTPKYYAIARPISITGNTRVHFTEAFSEIPLSKMRKITDLCCQIPYLPKPSRLDDDVTGINIAISLSHGKACYTIHYECGGHDPCSIEFNQDQLVRKLRRIGL